MPTLSGDTPTPAGADLQDAPVSHTLPTGLPRVFAYTVTTIFPNWPLFSR
jgi:hypothetical protein